ncbi:MAG: ABC transporter permease [Spirochaetaceae bacterium]
MARRNRFIDGVLRDLTIATVALVAWELVRLVFGAGSSLMPSVVTVFGALGTGILEGKLLGQLLLSLAYIGAALALSGLVGLMLVATTRMAPVSRRAIVSVTSLLHPLPGVALLPVVILWAGVGPVATLVVVVHSVLWPFVTNLLAGVESVPEGHRLFGSNLGLSPGQLFLRVELPGSMPSIIAGGRIAWSRGWRAFISAEMIFGAVAGEGGIGWYLFNRRVFMDTPGLFAGLLLVMLVGIAVENGLFGLVERHTVGRWGISSV